jgi:hypothetical protein
MIDPTLEPPIALADVPKIRWLPKRPHICSVFRWAQKGLRGHRLEVISIGGTRCTSEAALVRFFERISDPTAPIQTTTTAQRARQVEATNRRLEKAGW